MATDQLKTVMKEATMAKAITVKEDTTKADVAAIKADTVLWTAARLTTVTTAVLIRVKTIAAALVTKVATIALLIITTAMNTRLDAATATVTWTDNI